MTRSEIIKRLIGFSRELVDLSVASRCIRRDIATELELDPEFRGSGARLDALREARASLIVARGHLMAAAAKLDEVLAELLLEEEP
jgi:hypothetical protein